MVEQLSSMAVLPEKDYGVAGADLLLSMCMKVLAQIVAAAPALYFTILPRLSLADADREARFEHAATGPCATGCPTSEACLASESSMTDSTADEEHVPTACKVHDETLTGPDTSVRLKSKEINTWLAVLKNKDDDDDDDAEDDEEDEDEEDDEDDVADEDDAGDEGEGEEAEGLGQGQGGDDDEDDDDEEDEDENEKGDEDEEEDEDAVEAEDEEDEDGVEGEEDDDEEDDEDDEAPEPPQKKRK